MDTLTIDEANQLETKYIPTSEFSIFIGKQKDNARLVSIDGHARWLVKVNGVEYICRPEAAQA